MLHRSLPAEIAGDQQGDEVSRDSHLANEVSGDREGVDVGQSRTRNPHGVSRVDGVDFAGRGQRATDRHGGHPSRGRHPARHVTLHGQVGQGLIDRDPARRRDGVHGAPADRQAAEVIRNRAEIARHGDRAREIAAHGHGVDIGQRNLHPGCHLQGVLGILHVDDARCRQRAADRQEVHRARFRHRTGEVGRHPQDRQGILNRDRAGEVASHR